MGNKHSYTWNWSYLHPMLAIPGRHLVVNFLYGMTFEWWHPSPCWVHRHCCDAHICTAESYWSNFQKRLELRKSGTYLQVDSFSIWKKPVISDALAVLWPTSGSSAYQLRVFAATVCQTGGQRRRLEWEAWSKSTRKSSPNSRAEGPWGTMWNQETNRFLPIARKHTLPCMAKYLLASEISSWARSIQMLRSVQGAGNISRVKQTGRPWPPRPWWNANPCRNPLATTPLVNLVGGFIMD